jgi:hypothetical protein
MHTTRRFAHTLVAAAIATSLFTGVGIAKTDFMGGLRFNAGFPAGEWKDRIDTEAFGAAGQIFYSPEASPFAIGLDIGWSNYGTTSREEPFNPNIPEVQVDVETWNNFAQGFVVLRAQSPQGPLQVYGDALAGFNYLYTESKVGDHDGEDVASTTNQDDTAFACGLGAGVFVPVWRSTGESKWIEQVSIDLGTRYIWGGQAEYLKEGSLHSANGKVSFETIESRTNLTQVHLGVTARF